MDQQETCLKLSEPFWLQTAMVNDYHSWERERDAAGDNGTVTNAIWVLMNRHAMTLEEARAACRAKAKEYAVEYLRVVEDAKTRDDLCHEAKQLLYMLSYGISGNAVWSLRCPRYHPDEEFTVAQREMAKEVWAEEHTGWARPHVNVATKVAAEPPKVEAMPLMAEKRSSTVAATAVVSSKDMEDNAVMKKAAPALGSEVSAVHPSSDSCRRLTWTGWTEHSSPIALSRVAAGQGHPQHGH